MKEEFCLDSATSFLKPLEVATLILQSVFSVTIQKNKHLQR